MHRTTSIADRADHCEARFAAAAFTLLELLVVIAIIALLISILMPSLATSRAEGHKAVCLSNMRGLGQSFAMYSDDDARGLTSPVHPKAETNWLYDGEYEYGGKTGLGVFADPDFITENRILNRYVFGTNRPSSFNLYKCPTDQPISAAPVNFEPFFITGEGKDKSVFDSAGTSYRLNNHIDFLNNTPFSQFFYGPYLRPKTRVPDTSQTILLEETVAEVAKWNAPNWVTPGWHRKMNFFNVLFVDTHAAPIYLAGQTAQSAAHPGYWYMRGDNWRMDCWPDKPIKDLP